MIKLKRLSAGFYQVEGTQILISVWKTRSWGASRGSYEAVTWSARDRSRVCPDAPEYDCVRENGVLIKPAPTVAEARTLASLRKRIERALVPDADGEPAYFKRSIPVPPPAVAQPED